jgi:hypothetical protein
MNGFFLMDKAAASRGDGLLPELRALLERCHIPVGDPKIVPLDRSHYLSLPAAPSPVAGDADPPVGDAIVKLAR